MHLQVQPENADTAALGHLRCGRDVVHSADPGQSADVYVGLGVEQLLQLSRGCHNIQLWVGDRAIGNKSQHHTGLTVWRKMLPTSGFLEVSL